MTAARAPALPSLRSLRATVLLRARLLRSRDATIAGLRLEDERLRGGRIALEQELEELRGNRAAAEELRLATFADELEGDPDEDLP